MPSGEESYLFVDANDETAAVRELLDRGVREIVVKRGSHGATYFSRDARIDVAGLPATEVDPTGAGDCFGAAFVSYSLAGYEPGAALRYANAAGAHAVTKLGPMEGAATHDELDALLARFGG